MKKADIKGDINSRRLDIQYAQTENKWLLKPFEKCHQNKL